MMATPHPNKAKLLAIPLLTLAISACQSTQSSSTPPAAETARPVAMTPAAQGDTTLQHDFNHCRSEALAMDSHARTNGATAQYLASAKIAGQCVAQSLAGASGDNGPYSSAVESVVPAQQRQQQMQLQALAVLNYLRAGDAQQARQALTDFRQWFAGKDLYLGSYHSFVDTVTVLLASHQGARKYGANVNKTIQSEMERTAYWTTH